MLFQQDPRSLIISQLLTNSALVMSAPSQITAIVHLHSLSKGLCQARNYSQITFLAFLLLLLLHLKAPCSPPGCEPSSASCGDFMIRFPICTLNEKRSEMPQHGQLPRHACLDKTSQNPHSFLLLLQRHLVSDWRSFESSQSYLCHLLYELQLHAGGK